MECCGTAPGWCFMGYLEERADEGFGGFGGLERWGPLFESEQEARGEALRVNEAVISLARMAVVLFTSLFFLLVTRGEAVYPGVAFGVIVGASVYSLWMVIKRPYERYAFLTSAVFASVADAALITLWLVATGGFASPYFPLWYVSIVAVSFRHGAWAALGGSCVYALAYGGLVVGMGQFEGNLPVLGIRVGYIFLAGGLASLLSMVTYQQTVAKQAYRDLAKSLERAHGKAEEHAKRLERSNDDLRQVSYAISHDVREPLRVIGGYAGLLERKLAGRLKEEDQELVEQIQESANRLDGMIESLLEYARLDRDDPPQEPVALECALEDALEGLSVSIEESKASIEHEDLPEVLGDPHQVALLFQNLVSNAIKYAGDAPARVHVRAHRDEGMVRVEVEDEGIGIPEAEQAHVFDLFHRGSGVTEGKAGEGIGLALCRRLVERHGGQMWVESEEGDGATFYFTLPAA